VPGLLPLHAWSALMSTELVLVRSDDHPFRGPLQMADLRTEVVPDDVEAKGLTRADLLGGLTPQHKGQAEWVVDRAQEVGEVAYLYGRTDSEAFTRTVGMEAARAGVEVEVVYFSLAPRGTALLDLVAVEARLRAPDGCPWDLEQDHASLARYAVEEVYELLEAIATGDDAAIAEELGDVLLQVVFHAQIAADAGTFDIDDVARGIAEKLIRRHPHVFADAVAETAGDVEASWEDLKAAEKPERTGIFDGVVAAQPALGYADKLLSRAGRVGFAWPDRDAVGDKVAEELGELLAADTPAEREDELGDLLLAAVSMARLDGVDPELALRGAADRLRRRVEAMAELAEAPLADLDADAWRALWDRAKDALAAEPDAG
jgi:XTP/dITP diphosphohydrolase